MFEKKDLSRRVWLIDEGRGVFILLMVLYHLFYDLVFIFEVNLPVFEWKATGYFQLIIAGFFVFISGVSSRFSRGNLKRGVQCFAFGLLMTAGTWLFLPSQIVLFGILHMLGISMILFGLLKPILDKIPPLVGLIGCVLLYFVTYHTQTGTWGVLGWQIGLPTGWYTTDFLFFLGLPKPEFWSSDYFPLLPWIFMYLSGTFAGVYVKNRQCPSWFYTPHSRVLAFLGRNTILIYLVHQPIIYAVLYVLFALMR
ncbi:putative membrane protein [Hydrogenoanaerobacterium saccharovorans]|uniref:Uncharacterized membrane protein n=1 Tax=Hydrogenoanaerobacterium saccharovorans TaxID=474960 RepID=A0A1H8BWD7_9FIRM|nr:heparan-alpha-glucosaminide N-acetyltransferase [Hydrogenoanaerobacterium saccharovorans]RPF47239.1 putative membrane protein [Hydrogenoanaerobacterium saccharovorans]SEM86177.1 Uncharacterized membrane protein [Hydrogenoanaerobacterium saccharovorans]